jgi:hypothetical protein
MWAAAKLIEKDYGNLLTGCHFPTKRLSKILYSQDIQRIAIILCKILDDIYIFLLTEF